MNSQVYIYICLYMYIHMYIYIYIDNCSLRQLFFEGFLLFFFMCRVQGVAPLVPLAQSPGSPSLPLHVPQTQHSDTKVP